MAFVGNIGATAELDDQIKEYLLFRGFTAAARTFESEISKVNSGPPNFPSSLSTGFEKSCNVDKLVESLMSLISSHDLTQLSNLWNFISKRYFSSCDSGQSSALRKIELSLFRCFLVNCVTSGRSDKILEFFEKSAKLMPHYDWGEWYGLPYVKNPELNDRFAPFFQRAWQETFVISLHNFLNIIFMSAPKPSLLNNRHEASLLQYLRDENFLLKEQIIAKQKSSDVSTSLDSTIEAKVISNSQHNELNTRSEEDWVFQENYYSAKEVKQGPSSGRNLMANGFGIKQTIKSAIPKARGITGGRSNAS
ncbi:WD repeat-containing protein 91-like [Symsagittifera roscoffensis]|uniref:WD repeat-containing protein 91-like n=1 Tax=Symsagittifera roscoffensis TaxID=84072 RepID=UPI00307CC329